MMKALVWTAPEQFEMRDTPIPEPGDDEIVVRVAYVGICGSELSGYLGHNALRVPPLVMGHEFSGVIAEDSGGMRAGTRVTVNPLYCTGESDLQRQGLDQLCPTRKLIGASVPGAFAQYVRVPASTVHVLPDGLSLREGALTEPAGCAVRVGELAGDVTGASCLVIGAGPIGLLSMQVLMLNGAGQVFIVDLDRERLAMGVQLGGIPLHPADTNIVEAVRQQTGGRGVAVSLDAVGAEVTRHQCVAATMTTGMVILSGLHEETSTIPAADIIRREIVVRGSFSYSPANFKQAIQLLAEKKLRLDPWIVEAPLAEGKQWFDRLIHQPGNVSKVLLYPPENEA